jgi:hypothetical protein
MASTMPSRLWASLETLIISEVDSWSRVSLAKSLMTSLCWIDDRGARVHVHLVRQTPNDIGVDRRRLIGETG